MPPYFTILYLTALEIVRRPPHPFPHSSERNPQSRPYLSWLAHSSFRDYLDFFHHLFLCDVCVLECGWREFKRSFQSLEIGGTGRLINQRVIKVCFPTGEEAQSLSGKLLPFPPPATPPLASACRNFYEEGRDRAVGAEENTDSSRGLHFIYPNQSTVLSCDKLGRYIKFHRFHLSKRCAQINGRFERMDE